MARIDLYCVTSPATYGTQPSLNTYKILHHAHESFPIAFSLHHFSQCRLLLPNLKNSYPTLIGPQSLNIEEFPIALTWRSDGAFSKLLYLAIKIPQPSTWNRTVTAIWSYLIKQQENPPSCRATVSLLQLNVKAELPNKDTDGRHYRFKRFGGDGLVPEEFKFFKSLKHGTEVNQNLGDGDEIKLGGYSEFIQLQHQFATSSSNPTEYTFRTCEGAFKKYEVLQGSVVKKGSFGKVTKVCVIGEPKTQYAVKIIPGHSRIFDQGQTYEISALKALNHPNISKLAEVFATTDNSLREHYHLMFFLLL